MEGYHTQIFQYLRRKIRRVTDSELLVGKIDKGVLRLCAEAMEVGMRIDGSGYDHPEEWESYGCGWEPFAEYTFKGALSDLKDVT